MIQRACFKIFSCDTTVKHGSHNGSINEETRANFRDVRWQIFFESVCKRVAMRAIA